MVRVDGFEPGNSGQRPVDVNGNPLPVGVWGDSDSGTGVFGTSGTIPPNEVNIRVDQPAGVEGHSFSNPGVVGRSIQKPGTLGESAEAPGVRGRSNGSAGVQGVSFAPTGGGANSGVYGSSVTGADGVVGYVGDAYGVVGSSQRSAGVRGTSGVANGVQGICFGVDGDGLYPSSGVDGTSDTGSGVKGSSISGIGVHGKSRGSRPAVYGVNNAAPSLGSAAGVGVSGSATWGTGVRGASLFGLAGFFEGRVRITGSLTKGGGGFTVDHPLDPENKYLSHSFVESPDMLNVYSGTVTTNSSGESYVPLPDYFEAANQDFRYQLTVIGQFAHAIVAEEVRENRFMVKTDRAQVKVSWQVTGVRKDAWAASNRITVEEEKVDEEKGRYLHPEAWGRPKELSLPSAELASSGLLRDMLSEDFGSDRATEMLESLQGAEPDAEQWRAWADDAKRRASEASEVNRKDHDGRWREAQERVRALLPQVSDDAEGEQRPS